MGVTDVKLICFTLTACFTAVFSADIAQAEKRDPLVVAREMNACGEKAILKARYRRPGEAYQKSPDEVLVTCATGGAGGVLAGAGVLATGGGITTTAGLIGGLGVSSLAVASVVVAAAAAGGNSSTSDTQ